MPDSLEIIAPVQIESWKQYLWLRHGFSTRTGGISTPYGPPSLNLGWTKEDDPSAVAENRRRFAAAVAGPPAVTLVTARQVHSAIVHTIHREDGALDGKLATAEGKAILEGDGLMTDLPGALLGVGTADCVPVLVVDVKKRAVAAFHAGWRGTTARIVEQGIAKMHLEYSSRPEDLIAAIGPSIGPCCYSVGEEVRTEFARNFPYANQLFHSPAEDKLYLNLWEANRLQLLDAGLKNEQITVVGECAACSRNADATPRFFSHRRDQGVSGRMLNVAGIVP